MDVTTTVETLKLAAKKFVRERDWEQYHSLKNLSMNVSIEAAELMEIFVWAEGTACPQIVETQRQNIENEVADVAFSLLLFCVDAGIDLSRAMKHKIALNAQKYPIDQSKGKSHKYTNL